MTHLIFAADVSLFLVCFLFPLFFPFAGKLPFIYLYLLGCSREYCVHCDWWLIFFKFYCWKFRDNWEDGNPGSWGTSPQYQVRNLAYSVWQVGNIFVFCSFTFEVTVLCFFFPSSSQEVLLHVHMKRQLLVLVGPVLLAAIIVKLEHQGIAVLPMVLIYII